MQPAAAFAADKGFMQTAHCGLSLHAAHCGRSPPQSLPRMLNASVAAFFSTTEPHQKAAATAGVIRLVNAAISLLCGLLAQAHHSCAPQRQPANKDATLSKSAETGKAASSGFRMDYMQWTHKAACCLRFARSCNSGDWSRSGQTTAVEQPPHFQQCDAAP